jgi:hypothetical protein
MIAALGGWPAGWPSGWPHPNRPGCPGRRGSGIPEGVPRWTGQLFQGGAPENRGDQAAGDRLGLPIVARLAHGHGFAVRLGPSPEGGVTATVRLPATVLPTGAVAALGRGQGTT